MRITYAVCLLCAILLFIGCQPSGDATAEKAPAKVEQPKAANPYVAALETAHQAERFHQKEVVSLDLELNFGGKPYAQATIVSRTNSSKIHVTRSDGATTLFDGQDVWLSPDTADWPSARFDIFTWQYFFQVAYKLSDPGTKWELLGRDSLDGKVYELGKLRFSSGTGDAPDDWYLLFQDPETKLIHAMAYIVTYSRSQEEAEKSPSLIVYSDYEEVEGIPFPMSWTFYKWNEAEKSTGKKRGFGKVSKLQFEEEKATTFAMIKGKKMDK
ncbi:MAG: hypothetical protein AAF990_07490 [Bacteroidota bacterium]